MLSDLLDSHPLTGVYLDHVNQQVLYVLMCLYACNLLLNLLLTDSADVTVKLLLRSELVQGVLVG